MKTLYIIGNGFDRAHNLNTSYFDFRTYLEDHHPDFLIQFENLYNIGAIDDGDPRITQEQIKRYYDSINIALWREFEEKIGKPDIAQMMDFSKTIIDDLCLEGDNNIGIQDTMDSYWREQYSFITKFSKYVLEWAESIDTTHILPKKSSLIKSNGIFLTFNYTDVLEQVYKIEDVLHIHGSIRSVSNLPPIMGHCNSFDIEQQIVWAHEASEEFNEGETSIHNAIANYLKSIFKDTREIINSNTTFWNRIRNITNVEIIGLSLGEADLPYIQCIKDNTLPSTKWIVYYFGSNEETRFRNIMKENNIDTGSNVKYINSKEFWK